MEVIDSLLDLGSQKLEVSVFVAEDRAMAVNPQLSRLNRVMLSGIAAALDPEQRLRFERFLQARRAPYMLAGGRRGPEPSDKIFRTMSTPDRGDRFLVLTPESLLVAELQFDVDSLQRHVWSASDEGPEVSVHVNSLIKRIGEQDVSMRRHFSVPVPNVRVFGDSRVFSIQIGNNWEGMPSPPHETWVKPRMPARPGFPDHPRGQFFNFEFGGDDSSLFFNMDSLMIKMTQEGGLPGIEVFKGDPRARNRMFRYDVGRLKQMIDSVVATQRRPHSKLDSLMREMEKLELRRQRDRKVIEEDERQDY
jgi:hypothetical protein